MSKKKPTVSEARNGRGWIAAKIVLTLLVAASAVWLGFAVWVAYDNLRERQVFIAAGDRTTESYALAQALKTVTARHHPRIRVSILEIEGATGLLEKGLVQLAVAPSDTPAGPSARSVAAFTPQSVLLARSDVDKRVVYALTQTLLKRGPELADAVKNAAVRPLVANLQKPGANYAPLHAGATAFYERDKTRFVSRYPMLSALALAGLVLVGLWGGLWSWKWIRRSRRKQQAERERQERELAELARAPWSFSRILRERTREVTPPVVSAATTRKRWRIPFRPVHRGAARPIDRQLFFSGAALGMTGFGKFFFPPWGC